MTQSPHTAVHDHPVPHAPDAWSGLRTLIRARLIVAVPYRATSLNRSPMTDAWAFSASMSTASLSVFGDGMGT